MSADLAPVDPEEPLPEALQLPGPVVVDAAQARIDSECEALVLTGDLCETARLFAARLKETILRTDGADLVSTLSVSLTELERILVGAKVALEVANGLRSPVRESETPPHG